MTRTSRSTTVPTFLDLVDTISRGGTEDWRELYEKASVDTDLQVLIARALPLVDPELGSARELWSYLLDTMKTPARVPEKSFRKR